MPRPLPGPVGRMPENAIARWAEDLPFGIFLVTVVVSLFRARDLPSVELGVAGTGVAVGPVDALLLATAVLALVRLRRAGRVPSPVLLAAAFGLAALVAVSALPNGSDALVAAGKLVEFAALTLGAAAFLETRERLQSLIVVVVGFATVAVGWGFIGFLTSDRGRQGSFMGEHDMAALATLAAAVGLARVHSRRGNPGLLAVVALAAGVVGTVLGASLASLIGIYLASIVILAISLRRGDLRAAAALVTIAVAGVSTAGTLALRQGELGFLQEWFGTPSDVPGANAASWSQRLIYAYIGGRVFLDNPVLGTGWHGLLPPEEFAQYVPDARERFPDQPPPYFPPTDEGFIPQQTYDQMLFELGLVGAAVFLVVLGLAGWRAAVAARRRSPDPAYVPAAWLAVILGALAGAALFGGSPLTGMFWLALGVVAAVSAPKPEPA
ncbi:MAG: O-antigen ligase family protein [Gaiellaceae bacterium]